MARPLLTTPHVSAANCRPGYALLGALYFCQGLPFGFFTQALPVLLRDAGHALPTIGLASLVALPWAMKFMWAPAVDRFHIRGFGRRKSWIVPLQLATVALLSVLAMTGIDRLIVVLLIASTLNLLSATQDVATDGLAVDSLAAHERGMANGLQVAGYRVGMIVGGGVLLIAFARLGPAVTFGLMGALTFLASVPVMAMREAAAPGPARSSRTPGSPLLTFLRRPGVGRVLGLVFIYKLGDALATAMLRPFLVDASLDLSEIGWLLGTAGFAAGLLGAVAGGALVGRLGRRRALLVFGAMQAFAVAGYGLAASGQPTLVALYLVCGFEHFAAGMATAALFTCMMDWSVSETSATDYTVQASAVVVATGAASVVAGFSAGALGYPGHFALASMIAFLSTIAVALLFPTTAAFAVPTSSRRAHCVVARRSNPCPRTC